jgi:hypothetical protein
MKATPTIRCPNSCKTIETDFKLVRYYRPHRTPFYRCLQCGREFPARYHSVFAGFHTTEPTIYRVLKALAEGNGVELVLASLTLTKTRLHSFSKPALGIASKSASIKSRIIIWLNVGWMNSGRL